MDNHKDKNDELAQHFSGLSNYWCSIYVDKPKPWDFFHHHAVIKRKLAVLDFINGIAKGKCMRILDAGCGAGVIMGELLKQGHLVSGLELSHDMIAEARHNLEGLGYADATLMSGSIEDSGIEDEVYDISICIGVLQYLKIDEKAIAELARVTKSDGYILLSLPNMFRLQILLDPFYYIFRAPYFLWLRYFGKREKNSAISHKDIQYNLTFRNRRYYHGQLKKLYKRYGLTVKDIRSIGYGPLTFWQKEYISRDHIIKIANKLERYSCIKIFSWLTFLADRWVILLMKES